MTALHEAEWQRVAALVTLAEASRAGEALGEAFQTTLASSAEQVQAARAAGLWEGLATILDPELYQGLVQLDIDLLALALAAEAVPVLAPRLQALQPHIGTPWPSLGLVQELLLLDQTAEVDLMLARLAPSAPLQMGRLLLIEGDGPYQTLRAAPQVGPAVLGRSIELGPPPGAYLVPRRARWSDLVLPPATLAALEEIVAWIRNRELVFGSWGARRLAGPLVLFNGPSGVGKSFSAAAIATELSLATGDAWTLFALDLGRILSKYVGETEKNLNRLLDALHGRRTILQIDEADGLLGKRGEVSDARDRYANLEVSHMLSRFETHDGPVILTTNLRANIDSAFLRRFQLVVDFPSPDREARARLWSILLPPQAPMEDGITVESLADAVTLGGGSIHNAAVFAAMLAADEGRAISYRHLSRAVWRELNKDSRQVRRSEIGFLANHLEEARP
jgi:hypothetical protein